MDTKRNQRGFDTVGWPDRILYGFTLTIVALAVGWGILNAILFVVAHVSQSLN